MSPRFKICLNNYNSRYDKREERNVLVDWFVEVLHHIQRYVSYKPVYTYSYSKFDTYLIEYSSIEKLFDFIKITPS